MWSFSYLVRHLVKVTNEAKAATSQNESALDPQLCNVDALRFGRKFRESSEKFINKVCACLNAISCFHSLTRFLSAQLLVSIALTPQSPQRLVCLHSEQQAVNASICKLMLHGNWLPARRQVLDFLQVHFSLERKELNKRLSTEKRESWALIQAGQSQLLEEKQNLTSKILELERCSIALANSTATLFAEQGPGQGVEQDGFYTA